MNTKKTKIMTTKGITDTGNEDADMVKGCATLVQSSIQRLRLRNQEKAETRKGSNVRIRKDHRDQRHVIGDQG